MLELLLQLRNFIWLECLELMNMTLSSTKGPEGQSVNTRLLEGLTEALMKQSNKANRAAQEVCCVSSAQ